MKGLLIFLFALTVFAFSTAQESELDWATELTGKPWDMSSQSDVRLWTGSGKPSLDSGVVVITGKGGTMWLSLRGALLDGNRYERVKVRARAMGSATAAVTCLPALSPYSPFDRRMTTPATAIGPDWSTLEFQLPLRREGSDLNRASNIVQELGLVINIKEGGRAEIDWVKAARDASTPSQTEDPLPYQDYRHTQDPLPELDTSFVEKPVSSFAVFSDPHFSTSEGPRERKQRELVRQLNALKPDFVLNLGDTITSSPWMPNFDAAGAMAKRILGELEVPLYYVAGNHDVGNKPSFVLNKQKGFGNEGLTNETILHYQELFGARTYYSFDHKGSHFVCIDTMGFGSDTTDGDEQMAWLEEDLASAKDNRFRFMFAHVHPMYRDLDEPGAINYDSVDNPYRRRLLELCERRQVDMFMCGHTHLLFFNRRGRTELLTIASSSFPRWPRWHLSGDPDFKLSYVLVRVYEDRYVPNLIRIPEPVVNPRQMQQGNALSARQVVTELSSEHLFNAAGVNADLVTEDLLAWSPGNLHDGLTVYPGLSGEERVEATSWSSEPVSSPEEEIEVSFDLGAARKVASVKVMGLEDQPLPDMTVILIGDDGEVAGQGGATKAGPIATAKFSNVKAREVRLLLSNPPPDPEQGGRYSARMAEVEVINPEGSNVALPEFGTTVEATSNRTIRNSGVYNSNPILSDERQWYLMRELGVNLVRLTAESIASRIVTRDGRVALHPPTRALLEETAAKGISYVLRVSADVTSPGGTPAREIAKYLSPELSEPRFLIEVDGTAEQQLELAKVVAEANPERRVILGGFGLGDVAKLKGHPELLSMARGVCVDADAGESVQETISKAKEVCAALGEAGGRKLELYINVVGGPAGFREAADFLATWTVEAARQGVTLFWWHATRGGQPFYAYVRREEPTLPAYALRLLATMLADVKETESPRQPSGLKNARTMAFNTSGGATLIAICPNGATEEEAAFDLVLRQRFSEAELVDLTSGTAQAAQLESAESGTAIRGLIWTGRPLLVRLKP